MYWENSDILRALWIVLPLGWLLTYAHYRRVAAAERFADEAMVRRLMPPLQSPRPWVKRAILLLGIASLIVAGARPRFGVYFENVTQRGVDLFVALDVSRSMTAEDVAPSRLERAKLDIRDLLAGLTGDRVGLVVFAGKPVVKVPLTTDQGFFRMVLDEVDPDSAPRGGSLIGDAIRQALAAMPPAHDRDQVIVLITDGEDQESYPEEAAGQAAERGVKIFTVGFGDSREGARIPLPDDRQSLGYVKEQGGGEHWSQLNELLLKEIASAAQGVYIPVGTRAYSRGEDLGTIVQEHLAGLKQGEIRAEKRKRYRERFQLFVCLGVALLLLEMAIPSYRQPDLETVHSAPDTASVRGTRNGYQ
jgi:Ca-activated chloride channel family protein